MKSFAPHLGRLKLKFLRLPSRRLSYALFGSFILYLIIMAEELIGNCLVAQSGGPTAVINASVAGVVSEALNHPCIEEVYGGMNGVLGILKEEIMDLAEESQQNIRGLRYTPASALGTCRFNRLLCLIKIKQPTRPTLG